MNEKKYDVIEENRSANKNCSYSVYSRSPILISGLRDRCLVRLIKPEDFLELRIVPAQRD